MKSEFTLRSESHTAGKRTRLSVQHGSQAADPVASRFNAFLRDASCNPLLECGDAATVLRSIPAESIDCAMTSPPYWQKREYANGGIGLERNYQDYIRNLLQVIAEVKRVLKTKGSFWLNIGDTYRQKNLSGIPWRVALRLIDDQGWILRNSVIWNKVKSGMDTTKDRLGNVHEHLFHFVKVKKYYYDLDSIRSTPRKAKVVNGVVVSATGVSGVWYKRQIELATSLTHSEKSEALRAFEKMLLSVASGQISDSRMIIRGQQRTTHSNSTRLPGRAKELRERGFYFLRYHPKGSKPSDVLDIIPEDTQKRIRQFAPYPVDLCRIPILATCPPSGIVLDPFCGTGTTPYAAKILGRTSLGIDIAPEYVRVAEERCGTLL